MFQKVFVLASLNWIAFSTGIVYGQLGGLITSLQKKEEGIDFSDAQISLIAFTLPFVCFFGFVSLSITTEKIGQRWLYILFCLLMTGNWLILYNANELYQFMISRIIGGVSVGALFALNLFVTSEYTCPNTRALFINIIVVIAPAIGTAVGHAMGILLHWRCAALFGLATAFLSAVLPYFWIDSPHWLASRGRFEECEKTFRMLHGTTQCSERQLQLLIKLERSKLEAIQETKCEPLKRIVAVLKKKYFWDIFILSLFVDLYLVASEKIAFSLLASVIIADITGSSNVLLFTFIVDGFLILGPCLSCFFIRKCSMRTLLFTSGLAANFVLLIFSLCYYFRNGDGLFNWINIGLLALYFIIINTGPYPVLETIYSEMFPLEIKMYMFTVSGSILMFVTSFSVFILPFIVKTVGYHGLFVMNSLLMSVSLVYIWWKLPETKGKTLQEIEVYFKTKNFHVDDLSAEQLKSLIVM
ncbi:uncharacterized protein LOC112045175 [Bicyclus anynana]|uniref:Uncharacterized protein LOC112045175 n=1 Tax=Bicyclus anynana TaxID=110368 RepID=A0ABM3M616_BICAN|nr:uncharacterized protein LOC112045175 [Bicyclus anynana]